MEDQEINLLDLLVVIVKRKRLIIGLCLLTAVASTAYSLSCPNIYEATAKVVSFQRDKLGTVSTLFGKTGTAADLVAEAPPLRPGGMDIAMGILKSNTLKNALIKRFDLNKTYGMKSQDVMRKTLEGAVRIKAEKEGFVSITVEDKDPARAAEMANAFVDELGRMSARLKLTRDPITTDPQAATKIARGDGGEFFVLKLLDRAEAPSKKAKPNRTVIVALATVTALFAGIFLAFLLEFIEKMNGADKSRWEDIKGYLRLKSNG